jgi:hypothetical protein
VPTAAVIDSQTVRAADTVPTAPSGDDARKKLKGRKWHVAADTGGLLPVVVVMTASLQGRDGAFPITAALREAFSTITWCGPTPVGRPVRPRRRRDLGPGRGDRQAPRPGQGLRPAPPLLGRGTLLRLADQIPPPRTRRRDLPATHEAMIWTAATWQLSNRLTR